MSEMSKVALMNAEEGLSRVRGNQKLYSRMLGMFLTSKEFASFEEKLSEGDLAAAGEVAHGIKGMTGNLALNRVFELSNALMISLRSGERNEALIDEYRQALKDTRALVEEYIAQQG